MNRRSFIKAATFYGGSIVAGLTLNPFGFLRKVAKADETLATGKYRWCYCDDVELRKLVVKTRNLRRLGNVAKGDSVVAVVSGDIDTVMDQMELGYRFQDTALADLGIENILVKAIPVISYSDAKRLHSLKLLGRRIYAT